MFTTIAAISNLVSPKTKGSGDRNEKRDDNVSPSPPSSSRPQFTSVVLADEDVIPRYNVSKLDELSKDVIPFRYEFMTPSEISGVFIAIVLSSSIAISTFIVSIVVGGNRTSSDIFEALDTISTINIVWSVLILPVMGATTFFTFRRYYDTLPDLSFRQKMLVRQVISGLVVSIVWGTGTLIQSSSILSSSCPLFNDLDLYLSVLDDFIGSALVFIFHWAAIDHIISKDNPNELLSEASRGLIYIPSVLIVGLELALRVAVNVDYLFLANPYTDSAVRSQGCIDINQGTFTCKLSLFESSYVPIRTTLFVVMTVSILLIFVYCVIAWKRLAKQSWHTHRSLNVSLRLYICNTISIAVVLYSIRLTQFVMDINNGGQKSTNPCTFLLLQMTASPEIFQLFSTWMISRVYLFTPIPKSFRDRPYYKMRITFLQTFAWGGGEDGSIKTNPEAFWMQVVGDEKVQKSRKERASLLRKLHSKGMSMRKSTRFGGLFDDKAWKQIVKEGDFSQFSEANQVRGDSLLRKVAYGPNPQVVQTQPVFSFEIMLKTMWISKIVYGDGVEPDEKVESRVKHEAGLHEKIDDQLERGLETGAKAFAPLRIRRQRSVDVMGGAVEGLGDNIEGWEEGKDEKGVDVDVDCEEGVEKGTSYPGFNKACDIAKAKLGLTGHYTLENDEYKVRCVIFHNIESKKIVVAFRGSKAGANFLADAKFIRKQHNTMEADGRNSFEKWWSKAMVHRGFLSSFVDSGIERAVLNRVSRLVEVMREGVEGREGAKEEGKDELSVLICGHSLGGALAQLCSFSIASHLQLLPTEISTYTFGCPGIGNIATCKQIEARCPATFNVINNTDWVYYVGKYASRVFHPGIPVQINSNGDLLVRPTFVESSFSHLLWRESIMDHLFASYQNSVAKIISDNPECDLSFALSVCPTLIDYVSIDSLGSLPETNRQRVFEQNLDLAMGKRKSAMVTRRKRRKRRKDEGGEEGGGRGDDNA
ncbi:hypothetical protein TrCOL_g6141 [Triparma columacea]|uniref:Fungal lipase-type domain-containing protein n=1 Tax=Triparma columacea TaxID=722753 RepID=A0A9W7G2H2_9STRA|nr:hypothetical protein TrCOL_g6141 [Triparma columacea]